MYDPQVNDYVIWENGKDISGWVYFKDDEYLTIEARVIPKDNQNFQDCCIHRNHRLLVLCYRKDWKHLKYQRKRSSIYDEC